MTFEITRTSDLACREAPCAGAMKDADAKPGTAYHIDIETLHDLVGLSRKEGYEIILGINDEGNPYLEIYDGYRE